MTGPTSSPISSRSVKVTYAGRHKRRRDSVAADESADESRTPSSPDKVDQPSSSKKKKSEKRTAPKQVDVFLPPPSPKRSRFAPDSELESDANKSAQKPVSKPRGRTPSIPTIDFSKLKASPSTPKAKPSPSASLKKSKSTASLNHVSTLVTPSKEASASKTTTPKSLIKRTEAQRIQFLKDHPHVGEFEPHRAFCTRCDKWVMLSGVQQYPLSRWNAHDERCSQKNGLTSSKLGEDESLVDDSEDDGASVAPSVAPSVTPSTSNKYTPRIRTEEKRRAYLEADPQVEDFREHDVQCKACKKWLKLGPARKYMLPNWERHKLRCSDTTPSGRVTTANRKLQLVNDSQAKSFTLQSVECATCDDAVVLEGQGDYNLTKWEEHKSGCTPRVETEPEPPQSIQSSPMPPLRSPLSVVSDTDVTVVACEASPVNRKRQREPEAEEPEIRQVRARTESYEPPTGSGVWEWFVAPWKTFVSGFKHGLGAPTVPET